MQFEVVSLVNECINKNTIYLILDNWDDWFTYSTLFRVRYIDNTGKKHMMGGVKIGQKNQGRSPKLPEKFEKLNDEFFSLGASEDYYEAIKDIFPEADQRKEFFTALNDIAYNLEMFEEVKGLDVVQTSLMRDFSANVVKNQFHRLTEGGAWLTRYTFSYFPNGEIEEDDETQKLELEFNVEPDDMPPSNIHVLIGKNGVGKTTLLKNMINSLESMVDEYGSVKTWGGKGFANIVYVSFSAFDRYLEIEDEIVPYFYIGLAKKDGMKNIDELAVDFAGSLFEISSGIGSKAKLWNDTLSILESDNTFVDLNIKNWSARKRSRGGVTRIAWRQNDNIAVHNLGEKNKEELKEQFIEATIPKFEKLSSGHKVILLIIVRLIELVEEKH